MAPSCRKPDGTESLKRVPARNTRLHKVLLAKATAEMERPSEVVALTTYKLGMMTSHLRIIYDSGVAPEHPVYDLVSVMTSTEDWRTLRRRREPQTITLTSWRNQLRSSRSIVMQRSLSLTCQMIRRVRRQWLESRLQMCVNETPCLRASHRRCGGFENVEGHGGDWTVGMYRADGTQRQRTDSLCHTCVGKQPWSHWS